ncbi:Protein of unknown function (DUF3080) [Vibrio sp. ES.051]|uniref:DUF3080 domain-containing protein n=1 Tax=Vibrio sp. ES.051 TaxID=1761909 RepID=UPI000BF51240|nr:DUF3080 domain-containing protein [Vibrio sp. ES.051]PFG56094.1 Protein of unknown function (DUF3080) [Vibrio sp. ES.051]
MRLILLFSTFLIGSCSNWFNSENAVFDKYHHRLANVLDSPTIPMAGQPAITIPSKRALFEPLPRLSIGLLESYQLRQCGLFNLLAEKNSQLGKVQDAFHDFDYQTSLLRTLNTCLTDFNLSNDERVILEELYSKKWQHFDTHLDNVLLSSDAMRKQLTASDWLSVENVSDVAHISDAFSLFSEMYDVPLQTISRLPDVALIQYQEEIEKSRLLGRLYYSMVNASHWLNVTTQLLEQNQSNVQCGENRDTTQFRYLNNVFNSIYVEEVQPYLAYLDSTYQQISSGIQLVEWRMQLHGHPYGITDAHKAFRTQILKHVQFWQALFKRCGVTVGGRSTL